jgi:hypothetical protein
MITKVWRWLKMLTITGREEHQMLLGKWLKILRIRQGGCSPAEGGPSTTSRSAAPSHTYIGLRAHISAKLGRCGRCMRLSLTGALIGWLAFTLASLLWPLPILRALTVIWAASFSLLWFLHLATFTVRAVTAARAVVAAAQAIDPQTRTYNRRQLMKLGLKGTTFAMLLSFPLGFERIRALASSLGLGTVQIEDCRENPSTGECTNHGAICWDPGEPGGIVGKCTTIRAVIFTCCVCMIRP